MKTRSDKWQVTGDKMAAMRESRSCHSSPVTRHAFTLIEVMVVVVLLSLIVLALMKVFDSTQTAFRTGVTDAGVMEGGRAAMDLMADDLRAMSPSGGQSNSINFGAVNFCVTNNINSQSLIQTMVGGNSTRTNVLENFFILSRGNQNGVSTWHGVGYAVATNPPSGPLYSLYRFATSHPVASVDPAFMFTSEFRNFLLNVATNSHLMDGVVSLTVRAYDVNGSPMTTNIIFSAGQNVTNKNVLYFPPAWGQAGAVHIFRQRVSIPNVDPSAYQ